MSTSMQFLFLIILGQPHPYTVHLYLWGHWSSWHGMQPQQEYAHAFTELHVIWMLTLSIQKDIQYRVTLVPSTRMLVNGSSLSAVYKVRKLIWIDYETVFCSHHHLAIILYLLAYLLEFSNRYTNLYPVWASGMSKVGELHCVVRASNKCWSYRNSSLSLSLVKGSVVVKCRQWRSLPFAQNILIISPVAIYFSVVMR